MGRYDRIKIFDGNSFRKPNRIKVFNGSVWKDLGSDSDQADNGRIKVYNGSSFIEATKHWVVDTTVHYSDWYTYGEFGIASANNYCYCPNASSTSLNRTWDFSCTVRKNSNSDKLLLYIGSSSESTKIKVIWLADGRIKVETRYNNGTQRNMYSNNYVGAENGFVALRVYQARNNNTMHIIFNGQETTQAMYGAFTISNASGKAGSDGVNFIYNFYLEGGANSGYGYGTISQDATTLTGNNTRDSWTEYSGHWE